MDYLSQIYKDDCYRDYTDCDPPISLAVISSKELHIAEGLSHFFDSSACFRLNHFRNLQSLLTQKVKESLPSSVAEVFKSNWCTKHVKLRSSCVIFCLDWDELGDASMDELWLSEVCNQIKESMRRFRCRVIIVLATEKKMSKNVTSCAQIEKLQYEVKLFLGSEFKSVLPLFEDGLDRHSAENLFRMVVELSTKYHRDEAVRLKSFAVEPTFRAVRRMFKTGWHCLVLKDHKAAKRCFEVAYRTLKDIAPFFPATELRICGTILLHHILHIVSAEASVSSEELCYQLCEDHIIWVGQALRSSSAENKQMAGFLRLLLLGECYDWLAQNTSSMAVGVRQDFLVASLVAFGDALDMILNSLPSSLSVTIPAYVGSECCLETHRCVFSCDHADLLSKRVKSTLNQVLSQTELSVEAIFISARASQLICGGEEVFVLLEKLRSFSTGTYREAEAVHKLLMESTKNGIVALSERSRAEFLYSVVSLCFGPGDRKKQRHYLGLLLDTVKLAELDMVTLSYPRMGCCAPFTVLCSFANKRQDCLKAAQLKLTLFTTSVDTIIVDCLCVIVSRFSGDKRMNSITHSVSKKPLEVRLHAPCSVSVLLNLEEPGMYHCTCIRGRIKHGGTCLNVGWNMDDSPTGQCSLQRCEIVGEVLGVSQHNPWICVAKPACRVDMVAPNNIMGVEGEEVSVDIVLRTDQDLEGRNSLVLPFVPRLYEFSSHELLEKRSRLGDGPQKGYRTVILDNLPSLSPCNPLRLSVKYRCLKAGKYIAPILFQCRSANYSGRDVLKKVQMDIFYPFSPTYTLLKVLPWTVSSLKKDVLLGSEARLSVPERSDAFVRREVFTLVSPRDCINEDASTMQNNRDILLYSVHREITANRVDLNVPKGEEIVLVVSMECQAIRGLDVQALDVVCAHGTTLRSLNVGTLPCHVDYLEKLTLTAKICALRVGTYSPGFVRIVVVPEGGTQRIVSDLPLPDLRVEDAPLALAVKGPSTVILGSPFLVSFDVVNKTVDSRNCELVVGKCEDFFLMGGRTQWSFSLGPNSIKSTEIILQPLCVGTVTLPSVFVRLSSEMASGTLASCQCNSQRVCVLPS
ncbi:hypothetical protein DQ04_01331000 [Trypanosoma grayi]|uniref:hypothetical protein n=1 Tax=Trypanosoma grayi TaxID=71804 RepID=UPI0004F4299D|nr:hypothetical protein DQ04_01331000 [Trypanosoma grayi]KEG12913.1 hypothetical protein DQ04_01331000 [Trypanosoma grayi]